MNEIKVSIITPLYKGMDYVPGADGDDTKKCRAASGCAKR